MSAMGRKTRDTGGAAVGVATALAIIVVGLGVGVALKYFVFDKNDSTAQPALTVTANPTPNPTDVATTPAAPSFSGHWRGDVTGDVHDYSVDATITDNGTTISANVVYDGDPATYPQMHCVGNWSGHHDGPFYVDAHEVITNGPLCIDELDVRLELNQDGTVTLRILYSDTYHPVGVLQKVG